MERKRRVPESEVDKAVKKIETQLSSSSTQRPRLLLILESDDGARPTVYSYRNYEGDIVTTWDEPEDSSDEEEEEWREKHYGGFDYSYDKKVFDGIKTRLKTEYFDRVLTFPHGGEDPEDVLVEFENAYGDKEATEDLMRRYDPSF